MISPLSIRSLRFAAFNAILVAVVVGCDRTPPRHDATAGPAKDPTAITSTIAVASPQKKAFRRVVEQPGSVHPHEETQLYARIPGYVGKIHVDIGQRVTGPKFDPAGKEIEPGQILAEILVPEMVEESNQRKALVRQSEADVEQARKALAAADAGIATMEASVVEARASEQRWASELKRTVKLVENGVIDAQVRDETTNQHKAAEAKVLAADAAVRKAIADRDKAAADVKATEARVDVAKAEARRLDAMLVYSKIRAPFDGIVTRRKVNTGDFVPPTAAKGEWLFTVSRLNPVRVVVDVPEAEAGWVEQGAKVHLLIPALHGAPVTSTVTRTSWSLAPGARTLRTEIELTNKDGELRPGMYVYARISSELPAQWTLPSSCVFRHGDAMAVFRIESGKAVRTPVVVGRTEGPLSEVLKWQQPGSSSWTDWTGSEIVAIRSSELTDGQPVQVAK